MTAEQTIAKLGLGPLPGEGGYFRRFYTHPQGTASAIHYLITKDSFSALHRISSDELFHFHEGHPAEMLQLHPDGTGRIVRLGPENERVALVPGGVWQGMRLADGAPDGAFALFAVSVHPAYRDEDFELGDRKSLAASHPDWISEIQRLTR